METDEIIKHILFSIGNFSYLFPIGYIIYKKGRNKFLYLASCYGAAMLISILLVVMSAPLLLFIVKVVPTLAEHGHITYIKPLLSLIPTIEEYAVGFIPPMLSVTLSALIYKRYEVFNQ